MDVFTLYKLSLEVGGYIIGYMLRYLFESLVKVII